MGEGPPEKPNNVVNLAEFRRAKEKKEDDRYKNLLTNLFKERFSMGEVILQYPGLTADILEARVDECLAFLEDDNAMVGNHNYGVLENLSSYELSAKIKDTVITTENAEEILTCIEILYIELGGGFPGTM